MGCDESVPGLGLIAAAAGTIGNARVIRLRPGWEEPCVLWAVAVGESGTAKSPALAAVLRPLRQIQAGWLREHEERANEYERERLRYEKALKRWRQERGDRDPPPAPTRPTAKRVCVSDVTVERLVEILKENPRGLLLVRDELSSWVGGFDAYKRSRSDAGSWLSMHRAEPVLVDRKADGRELHVPRAAVSIVGSITPDALYRHLGEEHIENGLAQRLLFAATVPRPRGEWTEGGGLPDLEPLFERLRSLDCGHNEETAEPCPLVVEHSDAAKAVWVRFWKASGEEALGLSGFLAGAHSKLEAACARIALVLEFLRWAEYGEGAPPTLVTARTMKAAVQITRWAWRTTQCVFSRLRESDERRELRELVEWLARQGGDTTASVLARSGPRRFRGQVDRAERELGRLVKVGLAVSETVSPGEKGGRPTTAFRLTQVAHGYETTESLGKEQGFVSELCDGEPEAPHGEALYDARDTQEEAAEWTS